MARPEINTLMGAPGCQGQSVPRSLTEMGEETLPFSMNRTPKDSVLVILMHWGVIRYASPPQRGFILQERPCPTYQWEKMAVRPHSHRMCLDHGLDSLKTVNNTPMTAPEFLV